VWSAVCFGLRPSRTKFKTRITDSTNVVAFIEKGSAKQHIQRIVFQIVQLLHESNNTLRIFHLYREDPRIQLVDGISKAKDTDNWSIDFEHFNSFHQQFKFHVDLFADKFNRRLTKFVTQFYCAEALAVDAFTIKWDKMVWICPPLSLLDRIHHRICNSVSEGVVIFPMWPAASYYCLFFGPNKEVKPPFQLVKYFRPYITQNENATATPLFGYVKFDFVALYFKT